MSHSEQHAPTGRALILGLFLIFFGVVLGIMTLVTVIGPVLGLLLVGLGIFVIWQSAREQPPDTFT